MSGYSGLASQIATASAIGHAGEILQGSILVDGLPQTFLVTLPAPGFTSSASAAFGEATPNGRPKAQRAAALASQRWLGNASVALTISSNIPSARGGGSSTADCAAAVRAVAQLAEREASPEEIATIVHLAEGASDPTMFHPANIVFLSRLGRVLDRLPGQWPSLEVAVVDLGGATVATGLGQTPQHSHEEIAEYSTLLEQLRHAFSKQDAAAIGAVASRSGDLHQQQHPHANWPALREAAAAFGAYGVARAHTGTFAAVLSHRPWSGSTILKYQLGDAS